MKAQFIIRQSCFETWRRGLGCQCLFVVINNTRDTLKILICFVVTFRRFWDILIQISKKFATPTTENPIQVNDELRILIWLTICVCFSSNLIPSRWVPWRTNRKFRTLWFLSSVLMNSWRAWSAYISFIGSQMPWRSRIWCVLLRDHRDCCEKLIELDANRFVIAPVTVRTGSLHS